MRKGVIYKVTCTGNNRFLIGSTVHPKARFKGYLYDLRRGKYKNPLLQNCYNKYGEDSIVFEVLHTDIDEDKLRDIENIVMGIKCARAEDGMLGMNMQMATNLIPRKKRSINGKSKSRMDVKFEGLPALTKYWNYMEVEL